MDGWLYEALVTESRWIAPSVAWAAILAVRSHRASELEPWRRWASALNVYAGVMIGTLAVGHLLAVMLKLGAGDLTGPPVPLLAIGVVLGLPSWLVLRHGWALGRGDAPHGRITIGTNLLLTAALLATGPLNGPLAIPALLNAVDAGVKQTRIKQGIAALSVAFVLLLFVGSVRFFLSGGSFEDFSGMASPSR